MLRDDVLLLLTEAEGYLSGEEMREKLGVSRAAVSQAVRALRADGYDIDAVTNRGYCLRARPDTLTAGDVLSYLPEARRATVQCFAQIDSTNSYLKAEAMCGAPDGLCAIADRQTAGRGRAGRPFRPGIQPAAALDRAELQGQRVQLRRGQRTELLSGDPAVPAKGIDPRPVRRVDAELLHQAERRRPFLFPEFVLRVGRRTFQRVAQGVVLGGGHGPQTRRPAVGVLLHQALLHFVVVERQTVE